MKCIQLFTLFISLLSSLCYSHHNNQQTLYLQNTTNTTEVNQTENQTVITEEIEYVIEEPEEEYFVLEPLFYEAFPVIYTVYEPSYSSVFDKIEADYCQSDSLVDLYYRKAHEKQIDSDDMNNISLMLNKERKDVFNNTSQTTQELRTNNKVYNKKWLEAQYRISKVLFLEDRIKEMEQLQEKKN